MKKRMFAIMMTLCIMATACTNNGETPVNPGNDDGGDDTVIEVTYSEDEIEDRIAEVGESYDGLNDYNYDGKGNVNMVMTEACCEAPCDAGATFSDSARSTQDNISYEEIDWNTESYNYIDENGFLLTETQPFSTFGADVDTATYANLRRSIYENDGCGISDSAIRVEEMINYFNYDYAAPQDGEKFGVSTALAPCPWNDDTLLLRVGVKAEEIEPTKGSNIVFLIDTSGSMFDNNKLPLAQEAFKILQENLTEDDVVSIVTYAGNETVVLDGVRGDDHSAIKEAIDSLEAYGATNGEGGIRKAYELAEKNFIEGGNNRIILATDGDLNVGVSSEADLIDLVEEEKESGVFLSCLGFGSGNYQDDKMEALADHGDGNYSYIDSTAEANRVLNDEIWSTLYTVAKDVKFQVEFNPETVKGYRLIGYENREMAAEDFADDTKDGGEVGSGQTVTVLYEIVTADSDYDLPEVESRYADNDEEPQSDEPKSGDLQPEEELMVVNIRYKEPDADTSELREYPVTAAMIEDEMDDDTSWAAGVAQFGMLLRDSEYKGTSTYEDICERLKKNPDIMNDDFKAEFIYMVEMAEKGMD